MVILGGKYRDIVTGVEGFATARCEYQYGESRAQLEWKGSDGEPKSEWIAEFRLVPADLTERP